MLNINEIKLIYQPCKLSCSAACIAMVTGHDVFDIINKLHALFGADPPYAQEFTMKFLVRQNILPISNQQLLGSVFIPDSINLVTVQSPAQAGGLHHIILTLDEEGEVKIFDPAINKKYTNFNDVDKKIIDSCRLVDCSY